MKLFIAVVATAAVAVACVVAVLAGDRQAHTVEPICSDTCDLATHKAAMQHEVAMNGMSSSATMTPSMSPMGSMATIKMNGGHMVMTPRRAQSSADLARADEILQALRQSLEPYKDYQVAEAAGYKQFLPRLPQEIYHFTSWQNALANEFSFDPTRPTSLMYKRVPGGYELVGAMYTAPRNSTIDQLNDRVPLSVATWHLHTNFCQAPPGTDPQAYFGPKAQFGLAGSITTQDACTQAGGTFKPAIYNWMVHVWPFETDSSKVWATEEHPGAMNH